MYPSRPEGFDEKISNLSKHVMRNLGVLSGAFSLFESKIKLTFHIHKYAQIYDFKKYHP